MKQDQVLKLFQDCGALLSGHFELSSGLHSGQYLQCALLLQHPPLAGVLSEELSRQFKKEKIDVVIAPAIGGIVVAHETARSLKARALFCERKQAKMTLRRGFELKPGENVLVVEDVVTTGGSVKEIIRIVKESKARLAGVGVLVERNPQEKDFGVKYKSLLNLNIETFPLNQCPLCEQGLPLVKPGSR
ncbi:MAG: orotate phosphoribosyltransferase [Candidatus Omnitrophota bacterium]|nr:orotate phosphoribosyltransferase [Candidatus Omnitrophota bacterium]